MQLYICCVCERSEFRISYIAIVNLPIQTILIRHLCKQLISSDWYLSKENCLSFFIYIRTYVFSNDSQILSLFPLTSQISLPVFTNVPFVYLSFPQTGLANIHLRAFVLALPSRQKCLLPSFMLASSSLSPNVIFLEGFPLTTTYIISVSPTKPQHSIPLSYFIFFSPAYINIEFTIFFLFITKKI